MPPVNESGAYRRDAGKPFGPVDAVWSYGAGADPRFVSRILGGVQRLPNGNTLICVSTAHRVIEVTTEKEIVHDLDIGEVAAGGNGTFRAVRVPENFEALRGTELYRPAPEVVGAASMAAGPHAPPSLASALGVACPAGRLAVTDARGAVFDPEILGRSEERIDFEIPERTAIGPARVTLRCGVEDYSAGIRIDPVAPALFSANRDGKRVGSIVAAHVGAGGVSYEPAYTFDLAAGRWMARQIALTAGVDTYLMLFGTGLRGGANATVEIGGRGVPVASMSAQAEFPGLDQVNVGPLPLDLAGAGERTVVLRVGDRRANGVTVRF